MSEETQELSTTALARRLDLPGREVFTLLKELGWIRRGRDAWLLTSKGEFEGGRYVNSQRFGRYIVWPESISGHAALRHACEHLVLSAHSIGRDFGVSGRYLNHVLAELGWIEPGIKGWRLTAAGSARGGIQIEDEETSIPYVKWPPSVVGESRLVEALRYSYGQLGDSHASGDLFGDGESLCAIDGHRFAAAARAAICNWLYFAGLSHACNRRLPSDENYAADFYLPAATVYIEYWGDEQDGRDLAAKLAKKSIYERLDLALIELSADDIPRLDDVLPRELLRHGLPVY